MEGYIPASKFIRWLHSVESVYCPYHLEGSAVDVPEQRRQSLLDLLPDKFLLVQETVDTLGTAIGDRYNVDPGRVVIAPNATLALHLVCGALLEPGDGVLVEQPTYDPFLVAPQWITPNVQTFSRMMLADLREFEKELDAMDRPRMIILSDLHNPTGTQIADHTYAAIAELAARRRLIIVVDEVFRDLAPPYNRLPQPAGDRGTGWISVTSFSKTYGWSGVFKCGWIVAEEATARKLRERAANLYGALSPVDLFLARSSLMTLEDHRREAVDHIRTNREVVQKHLSPLMGQKLLECAISPHGSTCFPRLSAAAKPAVQALEKAGVRVAPGEYFGDECSFRIGYGGPTHTLVSGMRILTSTLQRLLPN